MPFVRATPNLSIKNGNSEPPLNVDRERMNPSPHPRYIELPNAPTFLTPLVSTSSSQNEFIPFPVPRNNPADHGLPTTPPDTPPEVTDLMTLKEGLAVIRTQLNQIHTEIQANISSQLDQLSSTNPESRNQDPISYKSTNNSAPGAILSTVQVVCAIERGLEVIVGVLENGKNGNEGEGEGLMGRCEGNAGMVAEEMREAAVGMIRVLKVRREHYE